MPKKIILGCLLLVFAVSICGCRPDTSGFCAGSHEREEGYSAQFNTMYKTEGGLTFHAESSIFDEAAANALMEIVRGDLEKMQKGGMPSENDIVVYVVPETLTGKPQAAGDRVFCTAADIQGGEYRQCLVQAGFLQKALWKCRGLVWYIFDREAAEEPTNTAQLKSYYETAEHLPLLSLCPAYFSSAFADERTMAMAENTAVALTNYIISEYGIERFIPNEDMTPYRANWLKTLGVSASVPALPLNMDAVEQIPDKSFPMVLQYQNMKIYFKPVSWLPDADGIYHFFAECFDAYRLMREKLQSDEPEAYAMLSEKMDDDIHIYLEDNSGKASRATADRRVILESGAAFCHEIVHVWVCNFENETIGWMNEGLADVISMPGAAQYQPALKTIYEVLTDEEKYDQLGAGDRDFIDHIREYASGWEKDPAAEESIDYAFLYNAIGMVLLVYPDCNTTLSTANTTVAQARGWLKEEGGNRLSYPEAYAVIKYLADTYGMEQVIRVIGEECSFEEAFHGDLPEILEEFQAYAEEKKPEPHNGSAA